MQGNRKMEYSAQRNMLVELENAWWEWLEVWLQVGKLEEGKREGKKWHSGMLRCSNIFLQKGNQNGKHRGKKNWDPFREQGQEHTGPSPRGNNERDWRASQALSSVVNNKTSQKILIKGLVWSEVNSERWSWWEGRDDGKRGWEMA